MHRPQVTAAVARPHGSGPDRPLVVVVLLNWNGWRDTLVSLESLAASAYPNARVVVCDNGSTDGSPERLREWADARPELGPAWTLISTGANLGFTGGCDVGIAHALAAGADYVFLLNNDARVDPEALDHLVAAAESSGAAVTGARVYDEAGERLLFSGAVWPDCLFGLRGTRARREDGAYWDSDYATGCAILLRRDLLEARLAESGHVFDPAFFMYCEELDLCLYARSRGFGCVIARDAAVRHGLAKSSGGAFNPRGYYYITRNRVRLAGRWLGPLGRLAFHAYYAPSRVALQAVGMGRWRARTAAAVARGVVDGYLGVAGKWRSHEPGAGGGTP